MAGEITDINQTEYAVLKALFDGVCVKRDLVRRFGSGVVAVLDVLIHDKRIVRVLQPDMGGNDHYSIGHYTRVAIEKWEAKHGDGQDR